MILDRYKKGNVNKVSVTSCSVSVVMSVNMEKVLCMTIEWKPQDMSTRSEPMVIKEWDAILVVETDIARKKLLLRLIEKNDGRGYGDKARVCRKFPFLPF